MEKKEFLKRYFKFIVIALVITLHATMRLSEIPYADKIKECQWIWIPTINFAAGQGFTDDATFLTESPELSNFLKSGHKSASPNQLYSLFDGFYNFKDYKTKYNNLKVAESIGYRLTVAVIWKYFGFNWYFVGLFNYFLSLMALLSLMYCSYKILGVRASVLIGLIIALSPVESNFIIRFPRDGTPLWFSCYLICALAMFFAKPLTIRRVASYASIVGILIYGATQGRMSSIYFLPLVLLIYFILICFLCKKEIDFKFSFGLRGRNFERMLLFFLASLVTICFTCVPLLLTNYFVPQQQPGAFSHVIFLGLGIWGSFFAHPSQVRYLDENANYLAQEFGRRALGYSDVPWLSKIYGESLQNLYLMIIKTYPYFFFRNVVFESIYNTLINLGGPFTYNLAELHTSLSKFLLSKTKSIYSRNYLFIFGVFGFFILYFKMKLKKLSVVIGAFVLINALMSPLQYNARHSLMGHPAYYFLSGITLAFFSNYIRKIFHFCRWIFEVFSKFTINIFVKHMMAHKKYFLRLVGFICCVVVIFGSIKFLENKLKLYENDNIYKMQIYFNSLDKQPMKFDADQKKLELPSSLLLKTIGIYCDVGSVRVSEKIKINFSIDNNTLYETYILPVKGDNVIVFIPLYFVSKDFSVKIEDHNLCKSYSWSDLKDWKGPFWQGSYDQSILRKE